MRLSPWHSVAVIVGKGYKLNFLLLKNKCTWKERNCWQKFFEKLRIFENFFLGTLQKPFFSSPICFSFFTA